MTTNGPTTRSQTDNSLFLGGQLFVLLLNLQAELHDVQSHILDHLLRVLLAHVRRVRLFRQLDDLLLELAYLVLVRADRHAQPSHVVRLLQQLVLERCLIGPRR